MLLLLSARQVTEAVETTKCRGDDKVVCAHSWGAHHFVVAYGT